MERVRDIQIGMVSVITHPQSSEYLVEKICNEVGLDVLIAADDVVQTALHQLHNQVHVAAKRPRSLN